MWLRDAAAAAAAAAAAGTAGAAGGGRHRCRCWPQRMVNNWKRFCATSTGWRWRSAWLRATGYCTRCGPAVGGVGDGVGRPTKWC